MRPWYSGAPASLAFRSAPSVTPLRKYRLRRTVWLERALADAPTACQALRIASGVVHGLERAFRAAKDAHALDGTDADFEVRRGILPLLTLPDREHKNVTCRRLCTVARNRRPRGLVARHQGCRACGHRRRKARASRCCGAAGALLSHVRPAARRQARAEHFHLAVAAHTAGHRREVRCP
jgi:hypothetical protein